MQLKISSAKRRPFCPGGNQLNHWDRVTHICVTNPSIIGWNSGLSPVRCQAIIWTNVGLLSTGTLGTHCNQILFVTQTFSFDKMYLKMSAEKMSANLSRSRCFAAFCYPYLSNSIQCDPIQFVQHSQHRLAVRKIGKSVAKWLANRIETTHQRLQWTNGEQLGRKYINGW